MKKSPKEKFAEDSCFHIITANNKWLNLQIHEEHIELVYNCAISDEDFPPRANFIILNNHIHCLLFSPDKNAYLMISGDLGNLLEKTALK